MSIVHARRPGKIASPSISPDRLTRLRGRLEAIRSTLDRLGAPKGSLTTRQSLSAELARLKRLLRGTRPACDPGAEIKRLEQDLSLAASGEAPYLRPGLHRMAYRSPLDRKLHGYVIHVPAGYSKDRRWPLVVMLHGMNSSPMRAVGRLFGVPEDRLSAAALRCDRPRLHRQDALVVAPDGHGDALYRLAGERDVQLVVQRVIRLFRVDRRRVTITGLSMGGTGAAEIALQRPHLYAGVLALCGYYDRRQDSQVRGKPLLPWEKHMASVQSPVDWAENGRGTPLVLIHGAQDGPWRARRMAARYRKLGFSVKLELYPGGHEVWVPGYARGRAFKILGQFRKGRAPRHVTLATGRSRIRRAYWVHIEQLKDYAAWGKVDVRIVDGTHVALKTENIRHLRLDLPAAYLSKKEAIQVQADGQALELPAGRRRWTRRVVMFRQGGRWRVLPKDHKPQIPPGLRKRPGLAGPLEDIHFDPVVVVYGTGGGRARHLRRVARKLAGIHRRINIDYVVMPDRRFKKRMARGRSVILVGNEQNNAVLARLGPNLPIRVRSDGVQVGSKTFRSAHVGAAFIYPNPEDPRWYVKVVGGTSATSYELFHKLPGFLPDYVVFDERIFARRALKVVGADRALVAGGYFDGAWRLPTAPAR